MRRGLAVAVAVLMGADSRAGDRPEGRAFATR